ncbi:elicitor peptide 6-like [Pistacia vera]|uniref:elicitor peptide 6-like n=1 Tax=Pistacia vera TaxID=55513 RepID=UPI0012633182|nr:elicitor peptide 6-like [Pistacia vera]
MEKSEEEKRRGEDTYYLYSPCSLFQQLIKACFKCLGREEGDDKHSTTPPAHPNSPSGTEGEKETKRTEEEIGVEPRAITVPQRPPRPPIDPGSGGQIN